MDVSFKNINLSLNDLTLRSIPQEATGDHARPQRPVLANRFGPSHRILSSNTTARTSKATRVWGINIYLYSNKYNYETSILLYPVRKIRKGHQINYSDAISILNCTFDSPYFFTHGSANIYFDILRTKYLYSINELPSEYQQQRYPGRPGQRRARPGQPGAAAAGSLSVLCRYVVGMLYFVGILLVSIGILLVLCLYSVDIWVWWVVVDGGGG